MIIQSSDHDGVPVTLTLQNQALCKCNPVTPSRTVMEFMSRIRLVKWDLVCQEPGTDLGFGFLIPGHEFFKTCHVDIGRCRLCC